MGAASAAGVVLTGGASRRMGRDKALVAVGGVAMARRVADALIAAGCDPVLAIGGDLPALASLDLEAVADGWPGAGPLGALATAIDELARRGIADRDLVAVACDLPWLDAATVTRLLWPAPASVDAEVVIARTDRVQPLCARWRPASFVAVRAGFAAGERAVRAVLDRLRVMEVDVEAAAVRNVNSPSDLPGGRLPS